MCDQSRLGTAAQIERMGSCGAVFAVERDAAGDAGAVDRGEQSCESCGELKIKSADCPDGMSDMHGEITVEAADGRIELTGYRLEDAVTSGTAADTAEPGVTPEPGSASGPVTAGACDLYSSVCEPKSAAKLKKYAQEDGLSLIKFWSVDTAYDGIVHRAEVIISGKERSCETGRAANTSGTGVRTVSVAGYDILGNRFSGVVEIK